MTYYIKKLHQVALKNRLHIKTIDCLPIKFYSKNPTPLIRASLHCFDEYMTNVRIPERNSLRGFLKENGTYEYKCSMLREYNKDKNIFFKRYVENLKQTMNENFSEDIVDKLSIIERLWLDELDKKKLDKLDNIDILLKQNEYIKNQHMQLAKDYLIFLNEYQPTF